MKNDVIMLRRLQASDLETRVAWMNNPRIYETMHFTPPISLDNTRKWFERNASNAGRVDVAFDGEDGSIVAMGGLTGIDNETRKAEFYVFVNPDKQRLGYGTRCTYLLCKYGFEVLHLHKIFLYTNATNIGARHTYEKVGFRLEGTMRDERINNDVWEDRLYYGLLSTELDNEKEQLTMTGQQHVRIDKVALPEGFSVGVVRDDLFPDVGGGGVNPERRCTMKPT